MEGEFNGRDVIVHVVTNKDIVYRIYVCDKISVSEMLDVADALNGAKRIFIAGIGRSGLIGKTFAMRLVHMGFLVYIVGDATTPAIQANDLLVIVTGSGTTKTLQLYAETDSRWLLALQCSL